jgi:hypothetical protein
VRRLVDFRRLWRAIGAFNVRSGLPAAMERGHLEYFFSHYREQLDDFAAQFEPTPGAVGCVVLLNGRVVGVERTPSPSYFQAVWRPLVRECYGSQAVLEAQRNSAPPPTRVPLRQATSRADLLAALREAVDEERRRLDNVLAETLRLTLERSEDEAGELTVEAVGDGPFVGQVVRSGGEVVYASLVAADGWSE